MAAQREAAAAASAADAAAVTRLLEQTAISDAGELDPVIDEVLAANADQVQQYRAGKDGLLGFFVGQVMRETEGNADPKVVNELLRTKLGV